MLPEELNSDPAVQSAGSVFEEGLTDEDISTLDAITKASMIKKAVAEAVANMPVGPSLTADETVLLADYRKWKRSPKCAMGVFHWRKPNVLKKS